MISKTTPGPDETQSDPTHFGDPLRGVSRAATLGIASAACLTACAAQVYRLDTVSNAGPYIMEMK